MTAKLLNLAKKRLVAAKVRYYMLPDSVSQTRNKHRPNRASTLFLHEHEIRFR